MVSRFEKTLNGVLLDAETSFFVVGEKTPPRAWPFRLQGNQKWKFKPISLGSTNTSVTAGQTDMAEQFPYALSVEGQWDPNTKKLKNKLNIYFQSKKSDGGDCEVEYGVSDGQTATVRFKTEEGKIGLTNLKNSDSLYHA